MKKDPGFSSKRKAKLRVSVLFQQPHSRLLYLPILTPSLCSHPLIESESRIHASSRQGPSVSNFTIRNSLLDIRYSLRQTPSPFSLFTFHSERSEESQSQLKTKHSKLKTISAPSPFSLLPAWPRVLINQFPFIALHILFTCCPEFPEIPVYCLCRTFIIFQSDKTYLGFLK